MTLFPTELDVLNNPTSTTQMNEVGYEHDNQHANANDAIEAIEARIGISGSSDINSLDFLSRHAHGIQSNITTSGNYLVDLNGDSFKTIFITGDLIIGTDSTTRPPSGIAKSVNIRIICDSVGRNISFSGSTRVLGATPPVSLLANHAALVSISAWGPNENDVFAGISTEL